MKRFLSVLVLLAVLMTSAAAFTACNSGDLPKDPDDAYRALQDAGLECNKKESVEALFMECTVVSGDATWDGETETIVLYYFETQADAEEFYEYILTMPFDDDSYYRCDDKVVLVTTDDDLLEIVTSGSTGIGGLIDDIKLFVKWLLTGKPDENPEEAYEELLENGYTVERVLIDIDGTPVENFPEGTPDDGIELPSDVFEGANAEGDQEPTTDGTTTDDTTADAEITWNGESVSGNVEFWSGTSGGASLWTGDFSSAVRFYGYRITASRGRDHITIFYALSDEELINRLYEDAKQHCETQGKEMKCGKSKDYTGSVMIWAGTLNAIEDAR